MRINIGSLIVKYKEMSEPVKASIWYTICNVLNKGMALLATPIFTRILTEEQFGTFSIYKSWSSIIIIFTSLNIFLGGYTKGLLLYRDNRAAYTSSSLAQTTFLTCVLGLIYLHNVDFWTSVFELPPILMAAMFLELTVMPAIEFWAAKERFDFKYQKYVLVSIAMTAISLVTGVVAVISSSHKVEARVFSDVLAKAIFAITIFVALLLNGKKLYVKEYWVYNFKFNLPLLPHYLSSYVLNQSDRLMIGKMNGNDKAAYYSVAYSVAMIMLLVTSAINNSLSPYIYKSIDNAESGKCDSIKNISKHIKSVTTPLFVLVAVACLVTMVFAPEIIAIFAGESYAEAIYVIPPIAASVFFIYVYSMFSTIEYYYQETGKIAMATTLSAIMNLILNYIFIRKCGYYAAGYTTLLCYLGLSVSHYIFYKKIIRDKWGGHGVYDVKTIGLISIGLMIFMVVITLTYDFPIIRYMLIFLILIGVIVNRRLIVKSIHIVRKE